jgi:hypothetical protein
MHNTAVYSRSANTYMQGLELRFHESKVAFVIEPAGSLLDYLDTG